jgi:uncharacterized protein with FMN-binding domain
MPVAYPHFMNDKAVNDQTLRRTSANEFMRSMELLSADRVDLLCAFIVWSGIRIVLDELKSVRQSAGGRSHLVVRSRPALYGNPHTCRHQIVFLCTRTHHVRFAGLRGASEHAVHPKSEKQKKRTNMNRITLQRQTLPLAMATLAAVPIAGAMNSAPAFAAAAHAAKSQTFTGATEYVNHGPVQVSIVIESKKIVGVKVGYSPRDGRSVTIQSQAIPVLKQETLRAQSARIQVVSGATDTSGGYITSLQSAINAAKKTKAFK